MKNPKLVHEDRIGSVESNRKAGNGEDPKGFDDDHINAVEIAKIIEDAGSAQLRVHGRTREQYYSGKADWDIIRQVKEAVSIPVIGNGDVISGEKCTSDEKRNRLVTAWMIGRGAWAIHFDLP